MSNAQASQPPGPNTLVQHLVSAWNESSFDRYCRYFTQHLIDHYNPSYFRRIRTEAGRWLSNEYFGMLKQGGLCVHLWRARFENSKNDVLFSLTLNAEGKIAGLLKRSSRV